MKAKYIEIAEGIAGEISRGILKPGDRVPSENEIISTMKVSNTTARKALSHLESTGLAKKIRGKGTIVLENDKTILSRALGSFDAIRDSFTQNLKKEGFNARVKIVEQKIFRGKISVEIAGKFYELSGRICKIRILRYANKNLLKDEIRYFSADICKGIENIGDPDPLVRTLFEKFGVEVSRVDRSFSAKIADAKEHSEFGKKPIALILLEGASISKNGKLIEIEKSFYNAERYKFTVESNS